MDGKWGTRAGVAAFAVGVSMAGSQALNLGLGVAAADTGNSEAAGGSSSSEAAPARPGRNASGAGASRAGVPGAGSRAAAQSTRPRSAAAERPSPAPAAAAAVESGSAGLHPVAPVVPVPTVPDLASAVTSTESAPVAVVADPAPVSQAPQPAAPAPVSRAAKSTLRVALTPAPAGAVATVATAAPDDAVTDRVSGRLPVVPTADYLSGALLLARRALLGPGAAAAVSAPAVTVVDPNQHVLLIGIDGTNLSAILADSYNQAFFDLMDTGTTGVATMVGHTTISNPSWTGILTGVWSETAGVSNNVFTPWTYDTWPTVFNQLEAADSNVATTVIGNWEVIAQIAGAGSHPADTIVFYPQINDSWEETDDAVGARSIQAIQDTVAGVPSFQMTYFVGVDDTGHDTGGAGTPEYAAALRNVNDNIAEIMAAVDDWEAANPGEEWTVIAVTDHGQVLNAPLSPILAGLLAHGFQSPIETTVFVIADGPDFRDGHINNTYSQMDITPTIMSLFGLAPEPYSVGKPLMDKSASDYIPALPGQAALQNALSDAISMYGYPDVLTDIALTARTIAATIPYAIYTGVVALTDALPDLLKAPIEFLGAVIYQLVNIPVQIFVRLTGVTGNSIIPPQWWPFYPVPGTQPVPAEVLSPAAVAA
ncbi:MAG: alkaline phosphatase family protein [Mycobacterium sp.]|nr:alkaline phosphatase family protein [Mycobacterium sp.]